MSNDSTPEPDIPKSPEGDEANPPKKSGCLPGCLILLIVVVGFIVILTINGANTPDDYTYLARKACQSAVEKQLKAPSTAKFELSADGPDAGPWTITGTVDAENSFGASLRLSFECAVRLEGETAYATLKYLE